MLIIWLIDNYVEILAAIFSLAGVWLTARQIIWCWPVALTGLFLSLTVFFSSGLYIQAILQIFYLIMSIYGWYNWVYGGEKRSTLKINRLKLNQGIIYFLLWIAATGIFGYIFSEYTLDSLPWLDSATSVCGILTTFMMAKKILENWLIWIVNDIIVVGMCFYQKLYVFSILYLIFILLAIYGWKEWKKQVVRS